MQYSTHTTTAAAAVIPIENSAVHGAGGALCGWCLPNNTSRASGKTIVASIAEYSRQMTPNQYMALTGNRAEVLADRIPGESLVTSTPVRTRVNVSSTANTISTGVPK